MSKKQETELKQDVRIALLQHFSSKSSNQVTNALTLALVFLTFVTAMNSVGELFVNWQIFRLFGWSFTLNKVLHLFFAILLALFVSLGTRIIARLLYWENSQEQSCKLSH